MFTRVLALGLAVITLMSTVTAVHYPPYCTYAGEYNCNLGFEWDFDLQKMHVWAYDRHCNQLADRSWCVGPYNQITTINLAYPINIDCRPNYAGPWFDYNGEYHAGSDCWHYESYLPWKTAGQCAFSCERN